MNKGQTKFIAQARKDNKTAYDLDASKYVQNYKPPQRFHYELVDNQWALVVSN